MPTTKTCVVVGAGPGNGLSFGKKFSADGYGVALLARSRENLDNLKSTLPQSHVYECDVTRTDSILSTFTSIKNEVGPVDVLIYNAGAGVFGTIDEIDHESFEQAWRVNTLGCFHCVKAVLSDMRTAGGGHIVVVGATAAKGSDASSVACPEKGSR